MAAKKKSTFNNKLGSFMLWAVPATAGAFTFYTFAVKISPLAAFCVTGGIVAVVVWTVAACCLIDS